MSDHIIENSNQLPSQSTASVTCQGKRELELHLYQIEQRIAEAEKMGFDKISVSTYNKKGFDKNSFKIEIVTFSQVYEIYKYLF